MKSHFLPYAITITSSTCLNLKYLIGPGEPHAEWRNPNDHAAWKCGRSSRTAGSANARDAGETKDSLMFLQTRRYRGHMFWPSILFSRSKALYRIFVAVYSAGENNRSFYGPTVLFFNSALNAVMEVPKVRMSASLRWSLLTLRRHESRKFCTDALYSDSIFFNSKYCSHVNAISLCSEYHHLPKQPLTTATSTCKSSISCFMFAAFSSPHSRVGNGRGLL